MFVGRSSEERELANEESGGWSLMDKVKEWAPGIVFGPAGAIVANVLRSQKKPSGKQEMIRSAPAPRSGPSEAPAAPSSEAISGMGGYVMTRQEIINRINREPNPLKRQRMIMNYQRAFNR